MEQLSLELDVENKDNIDISDDTENCEDNNNLIYTSRLRDLVKSIAEFEDFKGIQIGKDAVNRLQDTSKYIITMLILEIIEELKANNRKQIRQIEVDKSLDKILAKASGIDTALGLLREDIETLERLNTNTAVNKANIFINYGDKS